MLLLTIDIGNTSTKICAFDDEKLVQAVAGPGLGTEAVETMLNCNSVAGISYCCVGNDTEHIREWLSGCRIPCLILDENTKVPLEIRYSGRGKLGADRIAAAVGAVENGDSGLVVDAGTAMTLDVVERGVFKGGNISPGLGLRFSSLHNYTCKLPMVSVEGEIPSFGHDTDTAIRSGVVYGVVAELSAAFDRAKSECENIKMILTGGDAAFLEGFIRKEGIPVSVCTDAVGVGLVRIFNYNNCL